MKRSLIYLVSFLFFSVSARPVQADIVVRSQVTSENEFQALAQALGHTPISDFIGNEVERKISAATAELFRQRLLDAQAEWLTRNAETSNVLESTPAIDQLLALATESDWPASERKVFATFYVRKFQLSKDPAAANAFAAFSAGEIFDTSSLSPDDKKNWSAAVEIGHANDVAFSTSLPVDVTSVLVDGRTLARQEFVAFKFARVPVRITLLSNTFQPLTLKLTGTEVDWPTLNRKPWIAEDCTIATLDSMPLRSKVTALGPENCRSLNLVSETSAKDHELIEKFGLERVRGDATPPSKPDTPLMKRPWFWGAVGAVALGTIAVVAVQNQNHNDGSVRPTSHDGW